MYICHIYTTDISTIDISTIDISTIDIPNSGLLIGLLSTIDISTEKLIEQKNYDCLTHIKYRYIYNTP